MPPVESSVQVILIGLGAIGKGVVRHLYACRDEATSPFPKGTTVALHSVIDYVKKEEEQEDRRKFLAGHFPSAALSFDGVDAASLKKLERDFAAANVRFRPETLTRWARDGRLQSVKLGGRRYVRRGEVRGLLRPRGPTAADGPAAEGARQPGLFEEI